MSHQPLYREATTTNKRIIRTKHTFRLLLFSHELPVSLWLSCGSVESEETSLAFTFLRRFATKYKTSKDEQFIIHIRRFKEKV